MLGPLLEGLPGVWVLCRERINRRGHGWALMQGPLSIGIQRDCSLRLATVFPGELSAGDSQFSSKDSQQILAKG